MCSRTWEEYDINEYFIKFLRISPILLYSTDTYNLKKIIYQRNLLDKLHKNKITNDELRKQYQKVIDKEIQKKIHLENFRLKINNVVKLLENQQYNNLIKEIDSYIN